MVLRAGRDSGIRVRKNTGRAIKEDRTLRNVTEKAEEQPMQLLTWLSSTHSEVLTLVLNSSSVSTVTRVLPNSPASSMSVSSR